MSVRKQYILNISYIFIYIYIKNDLRKKNKTPKHRWHPIVHSILS